MLRTQLYVPSNDEKKIRKSLNLDCDSIIFDLEDAVPEQEKFAARSTLHKMLGELDWKEKELGARINKRQDGKDEYLRDDCEMVRGEEKISFLVLPKAEGSLSLLSKESGKKLMPLIESARGLLSVEEITRSEGVFALGYGAADFANSMRGATRLYLENSYVKTKLAVAARAYGVAPIDNVFFDLADLEGFKREALESRELGYEGKQVIHPSQIPVANLVFSPSGEEIERARRLVEAYEAAEKETKSGAIRFEDELVDAVHYRRAKSVLEHSGSN